MQAQQTHPCGSPICPQAVPPWEGIGAGGTRHVGGAVHHGRAAGLRRWKVCRLWKRKAEHQSCNQQLQLLSAAFPETPCCQWK